jgi:hypothetical protein
MSRMIRSASVASTVAVCVAASPAGAHAAIITFGSNLAGPATTALTNPVDTAFWQTSVSGGSRVRAPQSGQVLAVKVRGCAKRGTGGQVPTLPVHLQVLLPGPGSGATVGITSGPLFLPACGGAVSGATVTTLRPVNLCVGRGQYVAFGDSGGFAPGAFPGGIPYEIFARRPGAATSSDTSAGGTVNGSRLTASRHAGLELLMQVQLATGRNKTPLCP